VGKISDALDKFSRERREESQPPQVARMPLSQLDYDALVNYDRETGHLVKYDRKNGQMDGRRIDLLRHQGSIQRLLDNELIHPGGKLTQRGLDEANRLERLRIARPDANGPPPAEAAPEERGPAAKPNQLGLASAMPPSESAPVSAEAKSAAEAAPAPPKPVIVSPARVPPAEPAAPAPPATKAEARAFEVAWPAKGDDFLKSAPAAITYDENAFDPKLVALLSPHSYEAEQFKILRTNILYPVAGDPPKSILLTSTGPEEGKTFAAANLAISIALNVNRHVLLIDADLRNPQLHQRFGFGEVPGLSNYLLEGKPLSSLLLKTKVDKLTLLASGPPPANPSELISSERMANLLTEVQARYSDRLIVIDAPPPRMAAETSVIARQVDGVLIVVRCGRTLKEELANLIESIGKKKILGGLVNYAETAESRYYGYKYGGYRRSGQRGAARRGGVASAP
jgi:capsular exopolysaccharide synthesis family protein